MNVKRKLVALLLAGTMLFPKVGLGGSASAAESAVIINQDNFKDDIFRAYVSDTFDTNHDGSLSASEIETVKKIVVSDMGINTLKGIEFFTSVTEIECNHNNLTSLDCSKLKKLETLVCMANRIKTLNVKGCTVLRNIIATGNELTSIDLSDNSSLNNLSVGENQLNSLDLSKNTKIGFLSINDNQIKSFDITISPNLCLFDCAGNGMTELKTGSNQYLQNLNCANNNLTSLDITQYPSLIYLECEVNKLSVLDLSHNTKLISLTCSANNLTSLSVANNPDLNYISISGNNIKSFDVSNCKKIKTLSCVNTAVKELNLTGCNNIGSLYTNCNCKVTGGTYNSWYKDHTFVQGKWCTGHLSLPTEHDTTIQYCNNCGKSYSFYDRLSGKDRYDTSIATAEELRNLMTVNKFDNIVVASGEGYADALSGSFLAYQKNAPILLTAGSNAVMNKTLNYIKDKLNAGGTVYILGGTGVVPESFETALDNMGVAHKRLAGADRYETNLAILRESNLVNTYNAVVCTGNTFADSLSASGGAMPVILVPGKLTDSQKAYFETENKIRNFLFLGGFGAVSADIERYLNKDLGYNTTRIAGKDRFDTSMKFAYYMRPSSEYAVFAYSQNFPDGLCAGPLAVKIGAPLILICNNDRMVDKDASYFRSRTMSIIRAYVLGGPTLISNENVEKMISSY